MFTPAFRVGVMTLAVTGIVGFMSFTIGGGGSWLARGNVYWFELEDAAGLLVNGRVSVAGIASGFIESIELKNSKARLRLRLNRGIEVYEDGRVEIRSDGILGDRYVEVIPGTPGKGLLASGSEIARPAQPGSIDDMVDQMGALVEAVEGLTHVVSSATQGRGTDEHPIGRIILNLERLTQNLADMVDSSQSESVDFSVVRVVRNLEQMTEGLKDSVAKNRGRVGRVLSGVDRFVLKLNELLGSFEGGDVSFKKSFAQIADSVENLDQALRSVEDIASKLNEGDGTAARLLNDDTLARELEEAASGVNNLLASTNALETHVDFRTQVGLKNIEGEGFGARHFFNFKLQPGRDRYYQFGLVAGHKRDDTTVVSGTTVGKLPAHSHREPLLGGLKFNALVAKSFYRLSLRGGLMESSGGVGVDVDIVPENLRASVEVLGFGADTGTRVRAFLRFEPFRGVYFVGGGSHLTSPKRRTAFVGAGLYLTNNDLKLLLPFLN